MRALHNGDAFQVERIERRENMVPWYWIPISWAIGEVMGIFAIIICMGSNDKKAEREWAEENGLLYKETNKESR